MSSENVSNWEGKSSIQVNKSMQTFLDEIKNHSHAEIQTFLQDVLLHYKNHPMTHQYKYIPSFYKNLIFLLFGSLDKSDIEQNSNFLQNNISLILDNAEKWSHSYQYQKNFAKTQKDCLENIRLSCTAIAKAMGQPLFGIAEKNNIYNGMVSDFKKSKSFNSLNPFFSALVDGFIQIIQYTNTRISNSKQLEFSNSAKECFLQAKGQKHQEFCFSKLLDWILEILNKNEVPLIISPKRKSDEISQVIVVVCNNGEEKPKRKEEEEEEEEEEENMPPKKKLNLNLKEKLQQALDNNAKLEERQRKIEQGHEVDMEDIEEVIEISPRSHVIIESPKEEVKTNLILPILSNNEFNAEHCKIYLKCIMKNGQDALNQLYLFKNQKIDVNKIEEIKQLHQKQIQAMESNRATQFETLRVELNRKNKTLMELGKSHEERKTKMNGLVNENQILKNSITNLNQIIESKKKIIEMTNQLMHQN